jgi:hypothetical protein
MVVFVQAAVFIEISAHALRRGSTSWAHSSSAASSLCRLARQAQRHVGIQLVQAGGELAAVLQVQPALQAFLDDAHGAPDGTALGLDVAGTDRAAGLGQAIDQAVEQHRDQLVRRGAVDAGADLHILVGLAAAEGRCGVGGSEHVVGFLRRDWMHCLSARPGQPLARWNRLKQGPFRPQVKPGVSAAE